MRLRTLLSAGLLIAMAAGGCQQADVQPPQPEEKRAASITAAPPPNPADIPGGSVAQGVETQPEVPLKMPAGLGLVSADLVQLKHFVGNHRSRPLVLHLWATWAHNSADEIVALTDLNNGMDGGVDIVGVSLDLLMEPKGPSTEGKTIGFVERRGASYPIVLFEDRRSDELLQWLGVKDGIPFTIVYGSDGTVWARYQRPIKTSDIFDTLEVNGVDVAAARTAVDAIVEARRAPEAP